MKVLNDLVGDTPVVVAVASDEQSFTAFRRKSDEQFILRNDSLVGLQKNYDLLGRSGDGSKLDPVFIYQEFWHSWKEFHPNTEVYK